MTHIFQIDAAKMLPTTEIFEHRITSSEKKSPAYIRLRVWFALYLKAER